MYKHSYLKLKNRILDINLHTKKYFLDLTILPEIQFSKTNVRALILPYAGSIYVKPIMDYCFSLLNNNNFTKILLLTTNHNNQNNYGLQMTKIQYAKYFISISQLKSAYLDNTQDIFYIEHSFLSILPYLYLLHIPVIILNIGIYDDNLLADILNIIDNNTLIIANTDLLHCGSNYNNVCPTNIEIEEINMNTIKQIIKCEINEEHKKMCGLAVIKMFNEIIKKQRLVYSEYLISSSDKILSDKKNSVGYCGIVYNETGTPNQNKFLYDLPKQVLESTNKDFTFRLFMKDIIGLFVTIYKNKKLRGCIGTFDLHKQDILSAIKEFKKKTAYEDNRFAPITKDELSQLTYSITYIEKPIKININELYTKFIVGLHGITLKFTDNKSATYLASVMPSSFNVNTLDDFKNNFETIKESLRLKAGSTGVISSIEIYKCLY